MKRFLLNIEPYKDNGKGPTYCHYYYKYAGGMRFSKTTFNYWANNIVDDYIKVNNIRNMTVGELLDRVADQFFLVQIILEFMETIVIFLLQNVLKS